MALRKEDPRPAHHPAHHVEEVLHLVPGPVTQGRVQVTLHADDDTEEVENFKFETIFAILLYFMKTCVGPNRSAWWGCALCSTEK